MIFKDVFIFVMTLLKSEFRRIKRTILILFFGCALIFIILNLSTFLKSYVQLKYANKEVLMLVSKGTEIPVLELNYSILNDYDLVEIENKYEGLEITFSNTLSQIDVTLLRANQEITLNVCYNDQYQDVIINPYVMELYDIDVNDVLKYQSTLIQIDDALSIGECDLILPKGFNTNPSHTFDNLLNVHYKGDLKPVIDDINQKLSTSPYQYKTQSFSLDSLLLGLINLLEKVLLGFGFIIFLVSSSNLGTLMPYFIYEFKDEITVFKHLGLKTKYLINVFMWVCLCMLLSALIPAGICALLIFKFISLITRIQIQLPLLNTFILIVIQSAIGLMSSHRSIKKATESVTY